MKRKYKIKTWQQLLDEGHELTKSMDDSYFYLYKTGDGMAFTQEMEDLMPPDRIIVMDDKDTFAGCGLWKATDQRMFYMEPWTIEGEV